MRLLQSLPVLFVALLAACAAPDNRTRDTAAPAAVAEASATGLSPAGGTTATADAGGTTTLESAPSDTGRNGANIDRLYFLADRVELDEPSMKRLLEHAAHLKATPRQIVTLTAYTENQGSRSYNLAIAEEELTAVTDLLRTLGVPKKQIRRRSPRLAKVAAPCTTPACRQKIRHVALTFQ